MYPGETPPPPMVFVCCPPCREHRCGFECKHAELDGLEFSDALLVTPSTHVGWALPNDCP